jgi:hypothetical protein
MIATYYYEIWKTKLIMWFKIGLYVIEQNINGGYQRSEHHVASIYRKKYRSANRKCVENFTKRLLSGP